MRVPIKFCDKEIRSKNVTKQWSSRTQQRLHQCLMTLFIMRNLDHQRSGNVLDYRLFCHYKFSGKRTTGGTRRAGVPTEDNYFRELPKFSNRKRSPRLAWA